MNVNITITVGGPPPGGSASDAAGAPYQYGDGSNDDLKGRYRQSQQDLANSLNYLLDALNGNQQDAADQCCEHHRHKHRPAASPLGYGLQSDGANGPQGPLAMLMLLMMILQKLMQMQQDNGGGGGDNAFPFNDGGRGDLASFGESLSNFGEQLHQADVRVAQRYGIPLN